MIETLHALSHERIKGEFYLPEYMQWIKPKFSYAKVDKAGDLLRHITISEAPPDQIEIIDNWRAAHYFPLNTFQTVLRRRARKVDPKAVVVQRIKRLSSIQNKLKRFEDMQLSRMQDIGGCRAVVDDLNNLGKLALAYAKSRSKHRQVRVDDYVSTPKKSGYRGVHFVYRYQGLPDSAFNGFRVEIQLRSKLQHCWATTVEIAGTFINQALKSSQGTDDWLRFFALAGSRFAALEGTQPVPDTPTDPGELTKQLAEYVDRLHVEEFLIGCQTGINAPKPSAKVKAAYYLLELDPTQQKTWTTTYQQEDLDAAFKHYFEAEKKLGVNAVLVSAQSVAELRRAYPNYFMDSLAFIYFLNQVLEREGVVLTKDVMKEITNNQTAARDVRR